ncbi:MAG: hypothetical protein CM15mP95_3110 [Alphaproteobacteria bacterium]|nr:MAG: hypothetical protein CM15mP95_3110 [Alphaproteobacteria bacterium]
MATSAPVHGCSQSSGWLASARPYRQRQVQWDNNKPYHWRDLASALRGHFLAILNIGTMPPVGYTAGLRPANCHPVSSASPHGMPATARRPWSQAPLFRQATSSFVLRQCGVSGFMNQKRRIGPDHPDQAFSSSGNGAP